MAKKKPTPKKNASPNSNEKELVKPTTVPIDFDLDSFLEEKEMEELSETDLLTFKHYFSNGQNGTLAWMATHPDSQYDSASVSFFRWLRNAKISPIVERIRKELAMDVFEAVSRMAAIARGNPMPFLRQGSDGFWYLDVSSPEAHAHMYLVESIETKRERRIVGFGEEAEEFEGEWVKVKLHSAPAAIRDVLKMHGKLINRTELTGKDGKPLNTTQIVTVYIPENNRNAT
jgi:hypothetical protein